MTVGTNFYWIHHSADLPTGEKMPFDDTHPAIHIGKRSAAGWYCWDCRETLTEGGESMVHTGGKQLDTCPKCGAQKPETENIPHAAAVELGFAEARTDPPTGIDNVASFSWAQDPETVRNVCAERPDETLIEDEYNRKFTCSEFVRMLESNCPIEFTHSVGDWFC